MQVWPVKYFCLCPNLQLHWSHSDTTIDIKINASREAVIERLRTLILGQKFPMCIKKGMKISGAAITTGRRIISVTGVMPFYPHYSENYFYMGSLIPLLFVEFAVCLSNSNKIQCKCEDQHVWSSNQCSKHGICGPNQNDTCRCITSLPADGAFCRPPPGKEVSLYLKSNLTTGMIISSMEFLRVDYFHLCPNLQLHWSHSNTPLT